MIEMHIFWKIEQVLKSLEYLKFNILKSHWIFMVTADWLVPISAVVNWYHLIALR